MSELTDKMFQNFWSGQNREQNTSIEKKTTITRQELYEKLKRIENRNNKNI